MRDQDLADSPLASHWPDPADHCDTIADRLREAIAPFVAGPMRSSAFAAIDSVLVAEGFTPTVADQAQIIVEALTLIYGDTRFQAEIRIIAKAGIIALTKSGESYQSAADEFGVTRACIHAHARRIEELTNIRPRRAKSDEARAKSVIAATHRQRPKYATAPAFAGRRPAFRFLPGL